jgi:hypothetical protein
MSKARGSSRADRSAEIRAKWAAHVAAWRDSGRRQSEYCRQRGRDPKCCSIWKGGVDRAPTLVPVAVRARPAEPVAAAIRMAGELTLGATLPNGVALRFQLTSARTLSPVLAELALLLRYGLPFDEESEQLRSSKVRNGMHVAHIDPYWVSMWTADIVRSAKKTRSQGLLEELDALCDVLENAENHDRRVRGLSQG